MSSQAKIGDLNNLEDSLPSCITEHLGEKSYVTDDVNQLPSFSLEEFSFRDDSSNHKEDSEMNTCSSLEKEINVMTQGDLDHLRESYSFRDRISEKA